MKFFRKRIIYRSDNVPYLIRWNLFECRWFSIKIHKILVSDHDCLHDHPWAFLTFLLKGGYVEYTEKETPFLGGYAVRKRLVSHLYSRFSLLYRPAEYKHRLEIHQPVISLVITFKKVRPWGFWTSKGWIPWQKYIPTSTCE